ncbi:MAG: hypothetical protein GXO63_02220, partial [Candidatus Micrarchaeota archaeon]|nr:hypothetical protein [Candidatus Micrarchaeota archaeon]
MVIKTALLSVAVAFAVLMALSPVNCESFSYRILESIPSLGSCTNSSECSYVSAPCSFGCWIPVSEKRKLEAEILLNVHSAFCGAGCERK